MENFREIKFRAWLDDEMYFSDAFHWGWFGDCLMNDNDSVLMQYTGLKDSKGVEIYADDILSDGETSFRVYHVVGGFAIKARPWANNTNNPILSDELIWQPLPDAQTIGYLKGSCEVIGNIYENPELL